MMLGFRPTTILAATLLLLSVFVTVDAYALRCGNRLVREGDDIHRVLSRCGEPNFVTQRHAYRTVRRYDRYAHHYVAFEEPVVIEEWIYDRGRNRFRRRLVFENGCLVDVERLGYGR